MAGEYCSVEGEVAALGQWSIALNELQERIAHRFRRVEVRARVGRYLTGLLQRVERKNGWQLAEAIGEAGPQGVQRLLNAASWDTDAVRDDLRAYVIEHLGDATSGVPIVDESGFPKKGGRSCGVAPRYCGTVGATANAQVGVFLAYTADRGAAFIDRALYLPRAWANDRERRRAAGIPKGARFVTKVALARRLLTRAFAAGVPARWVVADSFYGRSHAFRRWLEQRGRAYVLMVPKTTAVEYQGRRERAEQLGTRLPAAAWCPLSGAVGAHEGASREWACLPLSRACAGGMRRWLLVRRSADEPGELAYHRAYAPADTSAAELARVCAARWRIEEGFAQAKGEIGLDQLRDPRLGPLAPLRDALPAGARVPRRPAPAGADRGGAGAARGGGSRPPPAHRAGGPPPRARARGLDRAPRLPARVVTMATAAASRRRAELHRAACAQPDPVGLSWPRRPPADPECCVDRGRVGARPTAAAAAAPRRRTAPPRPPHRAERDRLGPPPARLLARAAQGVRQVGNRLQTLPTVARRRALATHRRRPRHHRAGSVAVGMCTVSWIQGSSG
jgi:SRSO17 transposase